MWVVHCHACTTQWPAFCLSLQGCCNYMCKSYTCTCHLPCITFKDSARPAELPRWLSWYSICLERRTSWVRVPPEAALLFLWGKKELSSGVVVCICLVSITDYSCTSYIFLPISSTFPPLSFPSSPPPPSSLQSYHAAVLAMRLWTYCSWSLLHTASRRTATLLSLPSSLPAWRATSR